MTPGYALLQAAFRELIQECKQVAEQQTLGGPQGPGGEGLRHAANKIAFAIDRDLGKYGGNLRKAAGALASGAPSESGLALTAKKTGILILCRV